MKVGRVEYASPLEVKLIKKKEKQTEWALCQRSKVLKNSRIKLKSLILAQIERWRHA